MFDRTSTPQAPWHAVEANSKWHARIKVLEIVTAALKDGVNIAPPPVNGNVARIAAEVLGIEPDLSDLGVSDEERSGKG